MSAVVFIGPTISAEEVRSSLDAVCLPPVAQGDVYRAARRRPRAIGIIDGYFHGVPSVWHKEILWAMSEGIHVFGSASMGALRAAELHSFGMQGIGRIFEQFRDGSLQDDDEVAVAHAPQEFGFQSLSEPMVNVRATLESAERDKVLSGATAQNLQHIAKSLFYAERTWETLLDRARSGGSFEQDLRPFERWLPTGRVDLKRDDARAMLDAMGRLLSTDTAPKRVDYRLEWTDAWNQVTADWSANLGDRQDVAGLTRARVLDELRLKGEDFGAASRRAAHRFLALREADRRRLQPDTLTRRDRMTDHRRKRALFRRSDLEQWLSDNQMDAAEFDALLDDEIRIDVVSHLSEAALNEHLVAELKLHGDYAGLATRADRKRSVLAEAGWTDPEPADTGMTPIQLVTWFFGTRLGRREPDDLESFVEELGLPSRAEFYRILAREYLYLTHGDEES